MSSSGWSESFLQEPWPSSLCFPATLMFNIVKVFVSKTPCWFLEIKKLSQFCISISCCSHYHYLLASDCMFAFLFDRGDGSVERKCPHFGKDCHRDRRTGPFWWEISWSTTYHWGYTAHGVQVSCCFFIVEHFLVLLSGRSLPNNRLYSDRCFESNHLGKLNS